VTRRAIANRLDRERPVPVNDLPEFAGIPHNPATCGQDQVRQHASKDNTMSTTYKANDRVLSRSGLAAGTKLGPWERGIIREPYGKDTDGEQLYMVEDFTKTVGSLCRESNILPRTLENLIEAGLCGQTAEDANSHVEVRA
jgi:hypothetical protein